MVYICLWLHAPMSEVIQKNIQQFFYSLRNTYALSQPYPVLVALSGGQDSVALLLLLKQLEVDHALCTVMAGHIVHNMQEKEEQHHEIEVVNTICSLLHIPLLRETSIDRKKDKAIVDIASAQSENPEQTVYNEADARNFRYACLQSMARTHAIPVIATAHHKDDTIETLLMRFLKAEGIYGMRGIPAISILRKDRFAEKSDRDNVIRKQEKQQQYDNILLVRPLLSFSKHQLSAVVCAKIEALKEKNTAIYHYDKSNADNSILRNKVRHLLVPVIRKIMPRFDTVAPVMMQDIQQILQDTGHREYYNTTAICSSIVNNGILRTEDSSMLEIERTPYPWFISKEHILTTNTVGLRTTMSMTTPENNSVVLQLYKTFFLRCSYTQKMHILLLAANYLGIRRISKRTLQQCIVVFTSTKHDKIPQFFMKNTLLTMNARYIQWQKNCSPFPKRTISETQHLSHYPVEESIQVVFNEGMWNIVSLGDTEGTHAQHKWDMAHGIEYTVYYKSVLILTQLNKYDTIVINNNTLTIKDVLKDIVWAHIIAIKEDNDIIMVPAEYFLKRTLISDSVLSKKDRISLVCTKQNDDCYEYSPPLKSCKVIVSYHSLHIIL